MSRICKNCEHFEPQSKPKCRLFELELEEKKTATQNTPIACGRPDIKPEDTCDDWKPKQQLISLGRLDDSGQLELSGTGQLKEN